MFKKPLDRLLEMHFRQHPDHSCLARLEQDVWRKIHAASGEAVLPWHEKIFLAFGEPQFRMASLITAVMLGVVLSPAFSPRNAVFASGEASGMEMFSAHTPYLVANLIENAK